MKTQIKAQAESRRGLGLIVGSAVLWGTVGVAVKLLYGLTQTNALSVGFWRLALAVPGLGLACGLGLAGRRVQIARFDFGLMLLIGVMTALYQVCYFGAIARVGVTTAVLVTLCTAPILVALLAAGWLGERLTRRLGLALGAALIGTGLLVGLQPGDGGVRNLGMGVGLALGSAGGYAVVTLCSRALAGRYPPLLPVTVGFSAGAVLLLPFALGSGLVVSYSGVGWGLLLYLGLVPTALAYVLFFYGMRHATATVASVITLLEPLTSTILAWVLFGERLGAMGLLGALLLLGALGLLYRDPS